MHQLLRILARLHRDERGVAMTEYLQVLLVVILGAAVAMVPLGLYLARYYDTVEFVTGLPLP